MRSNTPRLLLSLLVFLISAQASRAQQPTFSADVKVVNVLATVRDKKGQIIRNLTKDDFVLQEDGRPQTIRYFSKETDLPLTLGLLVDTSLSQRRVLDQERNASYTFLDEMLRERDVAFLIHFDGEVELLQDLTSSRKDLQAALGSLHTPELQARSGGSLPGSSGPGSPGGWPGGGSRRPRGADHGGGTALYDAVFLASDELMKKQSGRKALIILSDGVDNASKVTLERAIEAAQRANTLVYSILFFDQDAYSAPGGYGGRRRMGGMGGGWPGRGGMGWPGGGGGNWPGGRRFPQQMHPDGKKILERISKETGARLFEVSKKQTIDQIYASIEEELRNQYSLGYTPDTAGTAGYRKIRVTTKQRDWIVQARDGYYAK